MNIEILNVNLIEDVNHGYYSIDFSGELDTTSLPMAREKIDALLKDYKYSVIVFDLTNLKYINSESIGYFFQLYEKLTTSSKKLVIVNARSIVLDVLSQIGIMDTVENYNTLRDFEKEIEKNKTVA